MMVPNLIAVSGKINAGKDTTCQMIQYLTAAKEYRKHNVFEEFLSHCKRGEFHETTHHFHNKKFSYKLKLMCSILLNIPVDKFEDRVVKETQLGPEWDIYIRDYHLNVYPQKRITLLEYNKLTPTVQNCYRRQTLTVREFMMYFATEAVRNHFHPNTWVNALFSDYVPLELKDTSSFKRKVKLQYPNWVITDLRFDSEYQAVSDKGGIFIRVNSSREEKRDHSSETELDGHQFNYIIDNSKDFKYLEKQVEENINRFKNHINGARKTQNSKW